MILYFSSTGNCKFLAQSLASSLGDDARSILETDRICLKAGEKLGFVFPTYFWRLPSIVDDYMRDLSIQAEGKPYIFFVATYGTTCGQTGTFMKRHLQREGFALSAAYSVKMADDWTVWFDLSDKNKVAKILAAEAPQIQEIQKSIQEEKTGNHMKNTLPMVAVMGSGVFYDLARRTKHLHVEESCISCGLCARECPVSAIEIDGEKPIWVKKQCAMCLHCLHSCPKFAIQYRNSTKNHGQYQHP